MQVLSEDIYVLTHVNIPIKEVRKLPKRQRVEFVVYYVYIAGFNTLGDAFVS